MPSLTLIAGANGSGKSTFVRALGLHSIDPDRIAARYGEGLTAGANLRASREALQDIEHRLEARQSLTLEVTLAATHPLRLLERASAAGYATRLAFITAGLDDTRLRIDNRVLAGGHNIPDDVLERRAPRVLAHLPQAVMRADLSAIYLSSRTERSFELVGAAQDQQVLFTASLPAAIEQALRNLPAGWSVQRVGALSPAHPVVQAFQALVQPSDAP